jgi:hypothetical protein
VSKLAQPASARAPLTVPQVAQHAHVCERTVWSDIKAGRLSAIHSPNGRTHVPRSALATYRAVPDGALTVQEIRDLFGMSVRSVRRRIKNGAFPVVRVSPRRQVIDAAHTSAYVQRDGTIDPRAPVQTLADMATELAAARHAHDVARRRRQRLIARSVRVLIHHHREQPAPRDLVFSAKSLARLSGTSDNRVYYEVRQGALYAVRDPSGRRRVWIRWSQALRYTDRPDVRAAIVLMLVRRFVGQKHRDPDIEREITRGLIAWVAAHPRAIASARW